jgi:hypothetical protein
MSGETRIREQRATGGSLTAIRIRGGRFASVVIWLSPHGVRHHRLLVIVLTAPTVGSDRGDIVQTAADTFSCFSKLELAAAHDLAT